MPLARSPNYETRFDEFIRMCRDTKKSGLKGIVAAHPSAIGDIYEEIIEGLSRLAEADLGFMRQRPSRGRRIRPRKAPKKVFLTFPVLQYSH
jgi:hypothetical protein